MSSFYVDFRSRTPIYEQLIENVSNLVLRGVLLPDELMPSVRQLAAELGINPNTIHKSYMELERRGIIYSLPGRGSFVSGDITAMTNEKKKEALMMLSHAAENAHMIGIERDDAIRIIDKEYEKK